VTTAAEYRQFAKECVESACAAASDDIRKQFLDIAKLWMEAADKMDAAKSHGLQSCRNSDALLAPESQSFLGNIVAGLRHSRAWKSSLSGAALHACTQYAKRLRVTNLRSIGPKSVGDLKGLDEFRF
jgi:hypothetical protein